MSNPTTYAPWVTQFARGLLLSLGIPVPPSLKEGASPTIDPAEAKAPPKRDVFVRDTQTQTNTYLFLGGGVWRPKDRVPRDMRRLVLSPAENGDGGLIDVDGLIQKLTSLNTIPPKSWNGFYEDAEWVVSTMERLFKLDRTFQMAYLGEVLRRWKEGGRSLIHLEMLINMAESAYAWIKARPERTWRLIQARDGGIGGISVEGEGETTHRRHEEKPHQIPEGSLRPKTERSSRSERPPRPEGRAGKRDLNGSVTTNPIKGEGLLHVPSEYELLHSTLLRYEEYRSLLRRSPDRVNAAYRKRFGRREGVVRLIRLVITLEHGDWMERLAKGEGGEGVGVLSLLPQSTRDEILDLTSTVAHRLRLLFIERLDIPAIRGLDEEIGRKGKDPLKVLLDVYNRLPNGREKEGVATFLHHTLIKGVIKVLFEGEEEKLGNE